MYVCVYMRVYIYIYIYIYMCFTYTLTDWLYVAAYHFDVMLRERNLRETCGPLQVLARIPYKVDIWVLGFLGLRA